jgi:hypothetical protein
MEKKNHFFFQFYSKQKNKLVFRINTQSSKNKVKPEKITIIIIIIDYYRSHKQHERQSTKKII